MKESLNKTMLSELKIKAKKQHELYRAWSKLPLSKQKKTYPPMPAIYGSDFVLSYKSNGLKLHKGFMLLNLKTKKSILI